MEEWSQFNLNERILENLQSLNFFTPTDIQKKVLVYANAKVDLIIQARTGEGKTLCYGIPIANYILNFYERAPEKARKISPVALIIVPTRELGIQVKNHITAILKDLNLEVEQETKENDQQNDLKLNNNKEGREEKLYYNIKIANVLGGFAKPKQMKILTKFNPEIIIATPGRLWEIIENEDNTILNKIKRLRFLVLDEADRMTEKGHFKELRKIIAYVYNKIENDQEEDQDDVKEDDNNEDEEIDDNAHGKYKQSKNNKNALSKKLGVFTQNDLGNTEDDQLENEKLARSLKKKKINVKSNEIQTLDVMDMFNDIDSEFIDTTNIQHLDDFEMGENLEGENEEEIKQEDDNNRITNTKKQNLHGKLRRMKKEEDKIKTVEMPIHTIPLRTFLCSATIEQVHLKNNKNKKSQNEDENNDLANLEGLIKNLKFYNKIRYVKYVENQEDTENIINNQTISTKIQKRILPERLQLECYKCESSIKDYYLFHILKENEDKKIIVFTNSISHTKKLFSIFSFFDFKLSVLHSKMQQSQRMKNLEKFTSGTGNVLLCTDVGARGLDIPLIDIVIHYHIPKHSEVFIHRSGRTARALKEGKSLSLISEEELNLYKKIMKDVKINEFGMKTLNVAQLEKYKSLFEYAKKVEKEDHTEKKQARERQWYEKNANECDMIFDEDYIDENNNKSDEEDEVFLKKKRKLNVKGQMNNKKIYHNIVTANIKRTSFLTPDMVQKLNKLVSNESMKKVNITQALFEAKNDAQSFKFKDKQRKKRYLRRRKK